MRASLVEGLSEGDLLPDCDDEGNSLAVMPPSPLFVIDVPRLEGGYMEQICTH